MTTETMKCKHCGCTDDQACPGGCHWVAPEVCSACGPAKLTRKAEVLEVLKAGGAIHWRGAGDLYVLKSKQGTEIPAWQTALKGALKVWLERKA